MMRSPLAISTVTCGLVLALRSATAHAAPPKKVSYVPTQVEVDAGPLRVGSQFEETMAKMALKDANEKVSEGLSARSVPLVKSDGEATIRITLRWEDYETSHYAADLEISRGGTVVASATSHCSGCDETMAAEAVAAKLLELLPFLTREEAEAEAEAETPTVEPPSAQPDRPAARKVGGAAVAGIAVVTAGLGIGIAGLALPTRDETAQLEPVDDTTQARTTDTRLRGSLIGIGSALLVTGAALIVVDQTVLRKRRARRMTLTPQLSPASAGVVWTGRF